jgi:L-fuculose-phosphate aldolase
MPNLTMQDHRENVASAARQLAAAGLVLGTSGNVSERAGDLVAITPTGAALADVQPEDVTFVDLSGEVVDGQLQPTVELDLHLGVYNRYDAGAVVHTHAPQATAVACTMDELPCIHYEMLLLGGAVPVAPYRTFGSPELAQVGVDMLEGRTATLLSNHGTLVYAENVATAVERTHLLEAMSALYLRAASLGNPRVLSQQDQEDVVATVIGLGYGTTKRID